MARSPPPLLGADSWLLPQGWGWGAAPPLPPPPPSGRSPASSPASSPARPAKPAGARRAAGAAGTGRRAGGGRLGGGQRRSASEREKLRMRNLSRALHELRRYLPPSVAPAGQSLTKIETLRLAARYIGHLSALLGLCPDAPGCRPERARAPRRPGASAAPPRPERPGERALGERALLLQDRALDSSAMLPGDVLSLLETWAPLLPQE